MSLRKPTVTPRVTVTETELPEFVYDRRASFEGNVPLDNRAEDSTAERVPTESAAPLNFRGCSQVLLRRLCRWELP